MNVRGPLKLPFHVVNRHILLRIRNGKPCPCNYIFCVLCDERRGVVTCTVRDLYDLLGLKSFQTNSGDPRGIIFIDENPSAVCFSIGLRNIRVV